MKKRCTKMVSAAVVSLLILSVLPACTTQQPLISHAHVGHALTTWHDTPDNKGLMEVAAEDLAVAERQATLACSDPASMASRRHAANVINALVPEAEPRGPASGYGAIRALMGTIEHLEYAATSADASLNLVETVAALSLQGESIHERLKVATELAQTMLTSRHNDFVTHCAQLKRDIHVAVHGDVGSSNTRSVPTIGFNALETELQAMLRRERDPSYAPVPRRYVLGLVRLPSGEWQYRLPSRAKNSYTYYRY